MTKQAIQKMRDENMAMILLLHILCIHPKSMDAKMIKKGIKALKPVTDIFNNIENE